MNNQIELERLKKQSIELIQNVTEYSVNSSPSIQKRLYSKYSSSQIYFYISKINQIVKQKRTQKNIQYQDIQYFCDQQEYLKRWYLMKQFDAKMFTFKEYYFYHQDCPRIFMKGIQDAYTKWQDKKRDLVYKKLKLIYNQDYQSQPDSLDQKTKTDQPPPSHFLLDISEYNPYSKKYYLRVQERKKKQKERRQEQAKKNKTKFQLSQIQHDLSKMLHNLSQLSQISTLYDTPKKNQIYQTRKIYHNKQDSSSSQQLTTSNSNNHSNIKFNFKKSKVNDAQRYNQNSRSMQRKKKSSLHALPNNKQSHSKKLSTLQIKETIYSKQTAIYGGRISPKFITVGNPLKNTQVIKTNSVFSVSSFGVLNKKPELKVNSKRQLLKINFDSNKKKKESVYDSQKPVKLVIKSQSQSNKTLSKQSLQKIHVRQMSNGKLITKPDEFSDKKLSQVENKLRSHKSQFTNSTSLKKPQFKIKYNHKQSYRQLNFGGQNLGIKKTLQLKYH